MNRTITVNVVKEFARQDSQNGGIQGSGNVDHLRLRFSEDWDGYAKTCVFWDANGENPVRVIVGADKLEDVTKDPRTYIIDIPPEPLAVEGTYTVVIDGYLDGKRGRSETIRLKSNGAQIADDAGEPADPTPSQAEQLQQEIEKIIPNIQSVATEAKSWAVGGTGSRDGEDTDNAKYYAQQSEKSAQESAQGLENISQQVDEAKSYAESAKTESLHAANHAQNAAESERSALESAESAKTAESNAKISEQSSAESAQQSEEARQAIENMTASAVSVGPDAEPYVKKTSSGGVVNLEFGLRDGKDGKPGPPGYTVPADGLYAFHIDENGDLIITYTGDEVPPFSIDENGNLIYTLGGNEVSIGHVADIGAQEAAVEAKEAAIQAEAQAQSAADAAQQAGQAQQAVETAAGSAEQSAANADRAAQEAQQAAQDAQNIIDDTKAQTGKTWSSLTIVDRLAPAFEVSGPVVTCNPVEGYPLHVVSQIVPVQEGEGEPSPDNVRPIKGWDSATLSHNSAPITLQFGQTIYGGTLDWTTGVLTVTWGVHRFNTSDTVSGNWQATDTSMGAIIGITSAGAVLPETADVISNVLCASLKTVSYGNIFGGDISDTAISLVWGGTANSVAVRLPLNLASSANGIKNWLTDNGVEMVYELAEPITIQLTPQEILSISGVNTIYTDTGDTSVSGRADPSAVINNLAQRIAVLESAATQI